MKNMNFYFLWLGLIMVAVFIMQILIPGFTNAFILNNKVFDGEIWRFLTSIFLHGGIIHLIYNLFALLFFGIILEKLIGSKKFLMVFFVSGIFANLIAINYYNSSLGASGAIYGIIGAITILRPLMMIWAFGLIMPMFIGAILWISGDLLRVFGFFNPENIGSIAHLSGIIIGILFGMLFRIINLNKTKSKKLEIKIPENYVKIWEDNYIKN